MADTKISGFTDGATAAATDRIAAARSPFASGDNRYITPAYILTYALGQANTWTAQQTWVAGSTSIAPFVFQSGTNLTAAAAGAWEYDGVQFYATTDTTGGRAAVCAEQYFHLTADGSTISTIANFFGSTSNIP